MRNQNEEPRGGSMLWYMTMVLIVMSAKVDTITADLICASLTAYAIWIHHNESRH
ncbi:hypothetical protein DSM100688_1692 [Bifidobacterium ramosum]|uniref:Uncharacterized protein n=1 Tax=Bifidobacterium ramosum TaxID=1798158 RepID=A0A6L4WZ08_9BIFI|nr:hypothetical protein [Bifidobacterium ramosum]KAB8287333.1 hypothetical protein DSM100688_1692 [Bifidobacterium ramosum]